MSKYTKMKTSFTDKECLVGALREFFPEGSVEVFDEPTRLVGFEGDSRAERAEIVVRRRNVGRASNDIGFAREADGTFVFFVSEYDRGQYNRQADTRYGSTFIEKLKQPYAVRVAEQTLAALGYRVASKEKTRGVMHLVGVD